MNLLSGQGARGAHFQGEPKLWQEGEQKNTQILLADQVGADEANLAKESVARSDRLARRKSLAVRLDAPAVDQPRTSRRNFVGSVISSASHQSRYSSGSRRR